MDTENGLEILKRLSEGRSAVEKPYCVFRAPYHCFNQEDGDYCVYESSRPSAVLTDRHVKWFQTEADARSYAAECRIDVDSVVMEVPVLF